MEEATTGETATRKKPLLINRNYARLWIGQAISNLGDMVFTTTLVLWVATDIASGQSWAPLAVSGVMIAALLPTLLVGPLAGVFVDRWEKRTTMLRMDATRAILVALLLLIAPFAPGSHFPVFIQLGLIYAVVALAGCCSQFFRPARMALIRDVVDESDQGRAGGLAQISLSLAIVIGPPLASPLLFLVGVEWALLINALSFVASFIAILLVRLPQNVDRANVQAGEKHSFWSEFGAGLSFFGHSRVLMTLLISIMIVTLGSGVMNILDVFFVTQNLHISANFYGIMGLAIGSGSVLGAVLSTFITDRLGAVRTFWGCLVAAGLLLLIFSRQTGFAPALVIYFFAGIPIAALNTALFPILLHATPRELLGRVNSILNPLQSVAELLATILAGYLASSPLQNFHMQAFGLSFGPIDSIFSLGGLLVILGGIYALFSLRHVRLDQQATAPQVIAIQEEDTVV